MSTSWDTPICALKVPSVHHLMVFPAGAWRKVWMQVQASHCYGTMCKIGRGLYGLSTEPEHKSVTECFRVGAQNTYWCFQPTTQTKYLSKASFERHRLTLRGRREPQCCDPPLLLDLARKQTRLWTTLWWLTEFILKRYTAGDPRGWITQVGSGTTCPEVSLHWKLGWGLRHGRLSFPPVGCWYRHSALCCCKDCVYFWRVLCQGRDLGLISKSGK